MIEQAAHAVGVGIFRMALEEARRPFTRGSVLAAGSKRLCGERVSVGGELTAREFSGVRLGPLQRAIERALGHGSAHGVERRNLGGERRR